LAQKVAAGHHVLVVPGARPGGKIDGAVHSSAFTDPRPSRRNAIGACDRRACNRSRAGISAASRSEKNRRPPRIDDDVIRKTPRAPPLISLLLSLSPLVTGQAFAVSRCTDAKAKVTYQDTACEQSTSKSSAVDTPTPSERSPLRRLVLRADRRDRKSMRRRLPNHPIRRISTPPHAEHGEDLSSSR
jgi:hypothetical protein